MPRPGPRPYECVRRAWHSDRHQPIRGTIIQEIFRSVNEIHKPATKKNKEWQDKLPAVVLKAEEIIYCKANSEAEYMDLKTLWGRVKDAINTIIRRDETSETEGLLQPCIEAALYLGCTPRRAPRSQRNCSPRCYLSPQTPKPVGVPTSATSGLLDNLCRDHAPNSYFMKPNAKFSTDLGLGSCDPYNCCDLVDVSFPSKNVPPSTLYQCSLPVEAHRKSSLCAVYPLYYGTSPHTDGSELGSGVSHNFTCHNLTKPAEFTTPKDLLSCHKETSGTTTLAGFSGSFENPFENDCDLSLRLGPLSVLCGLKRRCSHDVDNFDFGSSQQGSKFSAPAIDMDKGLVAFPRGKCDRPLDLFSRKRRNFECRSSNEKAEDEL